jgi:DNA-binding GntR family transcriptional regulator
MATVSLSQRAYQHIQREIVSGQLEPGSVISETLLAKQLGISRTPVGEAIRKLAQEGLVEQVPRYGTIVCEIDQRKILELYELREALEPYAARQAAPRMTGSELAQLRLLCATIEEISEELCASEMDALDDEMLRRFLAADMTFHLLIIRSAGNRLILDTVRDTRTISQIFRTRRNVHDRSLVLEARRDHEAILAALEAGDGEAAAERLLQHVRASKEKTLRYLQSRQELSGLNQALTVELPSVVREELERLERADNQTVFSLPKKTSPPMRSARC